MRKPLLTAVSLVWLTACSGGANNGVNLADLDETTLRDEPVMFSVKDDDSEVILFGTFHVLPTDIEWTSDTLSAAIDRADEVWFELPAGADADPALQQLTMQLGMSDVPLSQRLSEETLTKLNGVTNSLGVPNGALDTMQPWMASITLPFIQMAQQGFDPAAGAEAVLEPMVEGKPRKAFETAEQQLRFFADMDMDDQIDMLDYTLDTMDETADLLSRMATSWASGDVDMLEDEVVLEAKAESPEMYDVLFTKRNAAWTDTLVAELEGSGTDFVAVGAGHLLGPDSVPVMLADRGYEVTVLTTK
jgi:uncharacterized protein YbaP (TraB family)